MEEIINYLKNSIEDEVSKSEKKSLKSLIAERILSAHDLNLLRNKVYELANEHVSSTNYQFILEWLRVATSAIENPAPTQSDSIAQAFFSPGDTCRNVIIQQIEKAISQLSICVFTISDDTITKSLLTAHTKGVNIKIITDNDKSLDEGSDIEEIARVGIDVRMDRTSNHMHHKFMVIDQQAIITGSYNWTRSAARYNHENILLSHEPGVIKSFAQEFDQLWNVMEKY
jgi:phosphatidylserine/phosphatidylglycerophosphate/cardiolipin synthase-like enzyme